MPNRAFVRRPGARRPSARRAVGLLAAATALAAGGLLTATVATTHSAAAARSGIQQRTYGTPDGGRVVAYWNAEQVGAATGSTVPWIAYVHGGGWVAGSVGMSTVTGFCRHEAAVGVACFSLDYTLAPKAVWPTQANQVGRELAWVRANGASYHLDPRAGFVVGHSAGALMAGVAGLADGHAAGIVTLDGATDVPLTITSNYRPGVTAGARALIGHQPATGARARSARVLAHVGPSTGRVPFLVVHDDGDPIVSVEQSNRLAAGLTADRFPVTYELLPGKTHATNLDATALSAIDGWLQGRLAVVHAQEHADAIAWAHPAAVSLVLPSTPATVGHRTTVTVAITGYGGPATGPVTLAVRGKVVARGTAAGGTAVLHYVPKAAGAQRLTAVYAGSRHYATATATGTLTVRRH
jgi:acetyl esterase